MVPFAALIPLVMQFAPDLIGQMFGSKAGQTVNDIAQVVETVTGIDLASDDGPARAIAAARDNPALAEGLSQQLGELNLRMLQEANRAEEQRRQAMLDQLKAHLSDTQNARAMAIEQGRSGGIAGLVPTILALVLVGGYVATTAALLFGGWSPDAASQPLTSMMLTGLVTFAGLPLGFYFGSSSSSKSKDAALARSVPMSALESIQR